jgi:hypothetical protein
MRLESTFNHADAERNSDNVQYSSTPKLHQSGHQGFEDEDDDEDSLSDVAFCARWLAVLSASEVGRTKRFASARWGFKTAP